MDASKQIDKYIADTTDWRGDLMAEIRKVVLKADPDIVEEWKWSSPVWSKNGMICSVGAFKSHVGMNFFSGAYLKDKHKLFNSGLESKNSRTVKFGEGDNVETSKLIDLVKEAVSFNS